MYRAPGRVNLIGEHTDYNDGFVMPAAIDRATWVAIGRRSDRQLVAHSETLDSTADAALDHLSPRSAWSDYVFGVAAVLAGEGIELGGADLLIASDVPLGAGLSSSAALEVSVAVGLLDTFGQSMDRLRLAVLCRKAENEFAGARCGIMDQFIATHGRAGHALMLDCRSLQHRALAVPPDAALVICNTMVRHSVAAGEYNRRREECEAAARALSRTLEKVSTLRDVTMENLERHRHVLSDAQYRRARHVISENGRVQQASEALAAGDLRGFGRLMAASHQSLKNDFAVSCDELDIMVDIASSLDGVIGARLTGGGFGGCTINLVERRAVDRVAAGIRERYHERMKVSPEIYVCAAAAGCDRAA